MAQIRFANNVSTQLIKPVAADDSTIEVRSLTQGLVWPNISDTGDYFLVVIDDISSSTWEIMKCTKIQVNGNETVLTVERGLEGTTATTFNAGSVVENRLTASTLDIFGASFPAKVEINRGGTGATTAADARTNLDVPSKADLVSEVNTRTSELDRLDQKITDNIPPAATTSVRGTVILNSAVDSVSETLAATPKAVKTAYDAAISTKSSIDTVDARVTNEVDTLTANIEAVQSSCAPTSHASSSTTYGLATDANYGHVRSDNTTTNIVAGEVVVKDVAIDNDVTDLASRRGQIGKDYLLPDGGDLNDLRTPGNYGVRGATWSNVPEKTHARVQVINGSVQATDFAEGLTQLWCTVGLAYTHWFSRSFVGATKTWSAWVRLVDATNLATFSTPGVVKPGTGTSVAGDGSLNVDTASTSAAGIVQLSSTTSSKSEATAATSKAVKDAYDKAVEAATNIANVTSAVAQMQSKVAAAKEIASSGYTSSQHWVRYTDGRQIIYSDWQGSISGTVTFIQPFTTNPALIGFANENIPANTALRMKFSEITGTHFKVNDWAYGSVTKSGCWVAMGTWK